MELNSTQQTSVYTITFLDKSTFYVAKHKTVIPMHIYNNDKIK
jgi:hypothetical protein